MYVACENPFPEETLVTVSLVLGAGPGETIETEGRIQRADAKGMAIQTEKIDIRSYEHLKQLVLLNSHAPAETEREIDDHLGLRSR